MRWFTFTQERFWRTRDSVSPKTKQTQKRMKNKSLFNFVAVQHLYKCTNWVKPFTNGGNPTEYKDGTDPLICAGTLKWSAGSLACKRHDLLLHKQNRKHHFYWRLPHAQLKTPMNITEKKRSDLLLRKKKGFVLFGTSFPWRDFLLEQMGCLVTSWHSCNYHLIFTKDFFGRYSNRLAKTTPKKRTFELKTRANTLSRLCKCVSSSQQFWSESLSSE